MIRVLLGALFISFSPVFVKIAEVSGLASAFWRMALGGAGLVLVLLGRGLFRARVRAKVRAGGRGTAQARSDPGVKPGPGSAWLSPGLLLAGLLCSIFFASDIVGWHAAILRVGPGLGTLLANFQALLLPLLALLLFREPVRPVLALALPLALAGLFLIVGPQWQGFGPDSRLGVFYGLGAAFLYSLYLLTLQRTAKAGANDPLVIVAVISFGCALLLGLGMLGLGDSFAIPNARSWAALLAYGLVAQVLGWVLITTGARTTPTSLMGLLLLLQPTCSYLWDVLFFEKNIGLLEGVGVLLALVGIYLGSRSRSSTPK